MIRLFSQPVMTASLAFLTKRPLKLIRVPSRLKYSTVETSESLSKCYHEYFDFSSKFGSGRVESDEIDLFNVQHLPVFLSTVKSTQPFHDNDSVKLLISTIYLISKINKNVELASTSQIENWLWDEWEKCVVENMDKLSAPLLTNILQTILHARLEKDKVVILVVERLSQILLVAKPDRDAGKLLSQIVVSLGKLYAFDQMEWQTRLSLEEKLTMFQKLSMEQIDSFNIHGLSQLFHGFMLLGKRLTPDFTLAFQSSLRNAIYTASPVQLSLLMYTLKECHELQLLPLSFNAQDFLEVWFDATTKSIDQFNVFNFSLSLHMIGRLAGWPRRNGPFFKAADRRIAIIGSRFTATELPGILIGFSRLGILPSEFSMNSLGFRVIKELPHFKDNALVSIIESMVKLGHQEKLVELFGEANQRITASGFNDQRLLLRLMRRSLECDVLFRVQTKFIHFAQSCHAIATSWKLDIVRDKIDHLRVRPLLRFEKWFGLEVFSDSDRRRAINILKSTPPLILKSNAQREVASCLQCLNIPFQFVPFIDNFFGVVDFVLSGRNIIVDIYSPNDYFVDTDCHITGRLKTNVLFKNALLRRYGFTVVGVPYSVINDNELYSYLKLYLC